MSRIQVRLIPAGLAFIVLAVGGAGAAVEYSSVADLTRGARQIVTGDVADVTSYWDGGVIKSRVTVNVDQYLVGGGSGVETLVVTGGTVGDLTLRVSTLPVFEAGDHVMLFLDDTPERLVGCFQGAYLTDGVHAAPMGPACQRVIETNVRPLDELLAEVQTALPAGVRLSAPAPYDGSFRIPRWAACGASWAYQFRPMGEPYVINANCADASAGDAATQRTLIQTAAATWSNAGADFAFTYGGESTLTSVAEDGTNLVFFSTSPPGGGSYIAATYIWSTGTSITECDLVFNDRDYTWWNGSGSCSSKMDIQNIATHEFGHFLCLLDLYNAGDSEKTMYGLAVLCETKKRTLAPDDIAGIIGLYGAAPDTTPPTPNPMTWATPPTPVSTALITMTASTAADGQSPPVQYFFHLVSGGNGGNDSAWQAGTTYSDVGLDANTDYTYQVKARDSASTPNETAYSSPATTATLIETPTGLSFSGVTTTSVGLSATGTLSNLTAGSSGVYFDSTTVGGDGGINVWVQTTTGTATGLTPNTAYTFQVKARNKNAVETPYSPAANQATLIETPTGVSFGAVTDNSVALQAVGTLTNLTVGSSGVYFDSTTVGGDGGINVWVQTTTDTATGLAPNTAYTFQVKARNQAGVETAFGPPVSKTTLASVPPAPALSNPTPSTLDLDVDPGGNPAGTGFAIQCVAAADPAWDGKYVDAAGNPAPAAVWQTDALWGVVTVQGLQAAADYCFQVQARNADLIATAFSAQACATTAAAWVRGDMNCDAVVDFDDISPFVLALVGQSSYEARYPTCRWLNGDIDGSGAVDFDDISLFVKCLVNSGCL